MKLRTILLVVAGLIIFSTLAFAVDKVIPAGPWNYVNGVWVKVELPDKDSPWEWIPGHWNAAGNWVPGHWKRLPAASGKHWVPGYWNTGIWVTGHWSDNASPKSKVWVPGHHGPRGKWIPGHWEYR
jgi:hypothetical protein